LKARAVFRGAVSFGLSFLLVSVLIVFLVGGTSFLGWVSWNWGMLSHEGRYGTGSEGFIRIQSVLDALTTILQSTNGTLILIAGFLSVLCFAIAIVRTRAASWQRTDVPFLVMLFVGASISFVALIKHYAPHYALPLCATLPCVLLLIRADECGRLMKVGIPLVSAAFLLNVYTYTETYLAEEQRASVLSRDVSAIEALPISAGEKRVWGYYIPAKASVARMIDQYAGSAFVHEVLNKNLSATDIVPNNEPAATNWRYVIFPKKYFPTRESIATNYPKQFDFAATRFALRETDSISELATCFLLSRSP
jgi:hypothetical protein